MSFIDHTPERQPDHPKRQDSVARGKLVGAVTHVLIKEMQAHILLPKGKKCEKLLVDGKNAEFSTETVGESFYVNFSCFAYGKASFEILFSNAS